MDKIDITAWFGHGLSVGAILGTLAGWFPPVAALTAFVWYMIQIYESRTVQLWFLERKTKRIARLNAQIQILQTAIKQSTRRQELADTEGE